MTRPAHSAHQITIQDDETIVFYGDSITQQNLYTAFIETFLISRFPAKCLSAYNFGWGGDTATGANDRFARDAGSVKPSIVFVNFGMNDAKDSISRKAYEDSLRQMIRKISAADARPVLVTTSVVDYTLRRDKDQFNETLSQLADTVFHIAEELKLDLIDVFHPLRELQKRLKSANPAFTMMPDAAHPNEFGHLAIAYYFLSRIAAPRELGRIDVAENVPRSSGAIRIGNVQQSDDAIHFDLTLPFIPFYVPPDARPALQHISFQQELNSFTLRVQDWDADCPCSLVVDGQEAAVLSSESLKTGVDLALIDGAPWAIQGKQLLELAQYRWKKHFEVWREMSFDSRTELTSLPSHAAMMAAQREYVRELSDSMRRIAQPGTYRVSLKPSNVVKINHLEVSPHYPYREIDFEKQFPPEIDPQRTIWTPVPLTGFTLDLGKHFNQPVDCVSYARLRLQAAESCWLHLEFGSDDGLTVFLDGKKLLARDVKRPCTLGDDKLDVELKPGANDFLFRITQFGGAYLFALKAAVSGKTRVVSLTGNTKVGAL